MLPPLSFSQQRLWLHEQLNPGSTTYHTPFALRLSGALDVGVLQAAFDQIVARHGALRTSFVVVGEEPRQLVRPPEPFDLRIVDARGNPDGEDVVRASARHLLDRRIDLERDVLLQATLVRVGESEHVLLAKLHHIASDDWSRRVLRQELSAFYAAISAGKPSPLPPLALQYADYARDQRQRIAGPELEHLRAYWHARLRGLEPTELPTDRPRPAAFSPEAGECELRLGEALIPRLREFCRDERTTPFMVFAAAFQTLLARHCSRDDVAVGVPAANRQTVEVEPLIGFFINTLVLRSDLSGDPTFRELVARVRQTALEAYEHQELPFEQLVADLRPSRDLSRNPLVQIVLNLVNRHHEPFAMGDLQAVEEDWFERSAKFDLTLYAWPDGPRPYARIVYARQLFAHERMADLLDQFVALLSQALADPEERISRYSLLTGRARRVLPDPTAALEGAAPRESAVDQVLRQAGRDPEREAVRWRDRSLRYGDLASAVQSLAATLGRAGVGSGDVVAFEGRRSPGLVVALLGIMAAGGVVLPLEPRQPAARKRAMVRRGRARHLVLVGEPPAEPWWGADGIDVRTLALEACPSRSPAAADSAGTAALPGLPLDSAAYVFFTSGSSGEPKGIVGTHGSLSHYLDWQRATFDIGPADRAGQLTAWSFDVILRDVLQPLTSGAVLCMPDDDLAWSPAALDWMASERISMINVVPSVARRWLDGVGRPAGGLALRVTFFAGEPLPSALVARWRDLAPASRIVNLYGLTETCMSRSWYDVPDPADPGIQPVGRPIAASQTLVVNAAGRMCGIGEPGEIVLRTRFGTRGYLEGAGDESRDRFRASAFTGDPADVVCHTGDRGRYRHDGAVEILGRLDDQIKVRGTRTEPREVELALERHPAVTAAAVVAKADAAGDTFLAAFVVGRDLTVEGLRAHLSTQVPAAMHPRVYEFLDVLPLSTAGKIDRVVLARRAVMAERPSIPYVAPGTAEEKALADVWAEVLGVERVGIHDNFFDLGGDSLLAARVAARAREALGTDLPLVAMFDVPTVAGLSARVTAARVTDPLAAQSGSRAAVDAPLPSGPSHQAGPPIATALAPEAIEERLAAIWRQVLNVPRVGVHDDFFELGGHSLLAAQVALRIQRVFHVSVPLRTLFEAPTVAALATHIRESAPAGGDQGLEVEARDMAGPVRAPIEAVRPRAADEPAPLSDAAPLSFAQQRLWFLSTLDPKSAAYHIVRAYDLEGPLDERALRAALDGIVSRHEALRTTFEVVDGEPRQVVRPAHGFPLESVDLRSASSEGRAAGIRRWTTERVLEPFDLRRDLPVRGALLQIGPQRHVLVLTLHHIAADGWSLDVFARELAQLYDAGRRPDASSLPALPLQYADFARWQRRRLAGSHLARLREYWRSALSGLPELSLPTDRRRPSEPSDHGAEREVLLPAAMGKALGGLARSENATLFMTLLAAFQALLGRWSGQTDFAVGVPIANRLLAEHQPLIGFFANTLAIRADLTGDPTVRELVARVRRIAFGAYEHDELPFEQLVADLAPPRDRGRNPVVDVAFSVQNAGHPLTLDGLDVRRRPLEIRRARFDLELHFQVRPDGSLRGLFVYATDLFDRETIDRLAERLTALLEAIVADPDRTISGLPMLPPEERQRLLAVGAETARDYPRDRGLAALFAAQAAAAPDATAVTHGRRHVTYAELDARATRIASHLGALGVGLGARVAICLERSVDLVAATLGVIKAGAVYVPLDPRDPPARLAFVIKDVEAPVVLTSSALSDRVSADGCTVVCLDRPWADSGSQTLPGGAGDDLAYVMYTSGSTGTPKGVMVPQRAVVRLVVNTNYIRLAAGDVVALAANPAFDAATFEIWGALLNGARIAVIDHDVLLDPSLPRVLRDQGVTTLFLTTALFNHFAREMPGALSGLRHVLFGGEAADGSAVRRVLAAGRPGRLLNAYGPTESTTFATVHEITDDGRADRTVPIGRPVANTTAYVLDDTNALAPIGTPGELCLGGDGLAVGYLNDPVLTAERFVPHPFEPGARLYRTGDRARWRSDGRLEFLGRRDGQVKLRGHRIELGEVEAVLAAHPSIEAGVVEAVGDDVDRRLLGYVVPNVEGPIDREALRRHLRTRLPEHMVPSVFVTLNALPLTPNGKVDRKALPAVPLPAEAAGAASRHAATETEARLARIWRDVFQTSDVGLDDDFFELGGHSLLAVKLVSLIERAFQVEVPLSRLLEHPTIGSLARVLDGSRQARPWTPVVPIRPTGTRKPLFLVHGVGGEVMSFTHLAVRLPADWPVYGIQAAGPGSGARLPADISPLAERYAEAMISAEPEGPYYIGGFSSGAVTALAVAQALRERDRDVALLLLIDGGLPSHVAMPRRLRHSPASLLRQMAWWVVDDALATPAEDWWPRLASKRRALTARLRAAIGWSGSNGNGHGHVRDRLGMWRFPERYQDLLEERFEAFQRHVPKPYDGDMFLIRSRTGRLFGQRRENLDEAWHGLARGRFDCAYVRASHHSLLGARVDELARVVADRLERAHAATAGTEDRR